MAKHQITKSFWADDATRRAEMRLEMPLRFDGKPTPGKSVQPALPNGQASQAKTGEASQGFWGDDEGAKPTEQVSPLPISDILPREEDLYYLNMRAISQRIIEGHWVDYTRPGVLEASAPLLNAQRICKDHCYWKSEDAIGAIVSSAWDAQGVNSNNLPGINIRFFVDSKVAPGIVRRLAYPVPAIHSGSVTVGFEWEPSHPDLLEDGKFWWFLGEEVDGSIVRLIVTNILFYREFSLVYEGADADAKRLPDEMPEPAEGEGEGENGPKKKSCSASQSRETKVKLTAEQKKVLGLAENAPDEVPEAQVIEGLFKQVAAQAGTLEAANAVIATERAEVVRLATLAELGSAEGQLPEVLAKVIANAAPADLAGFKQLYGEKAQAKVGAGRSSVEPDHGFKGQGQNAKPVEKVPFL